MLIKLDYMSEFTGKVSNNKNVANKTIPLQMPSFLKEFPEIGNCFPATINIELEAPLLVLNGDHTTKPIHWFNGAPEIFKFVRIKLTYKHNPTFGKDPDKINYGVSFIDRTIDAWLYVPQDSPHRKNYYLHEIMAEKIPVKAGDILKITFDNPVIGPII